MIPCSGTTRGLLLALAILASSLRRSSTADEGPHVLNAQSKPAIAAVFKRMKPELRYTDVGIDHDHVLAHLCPQAAAEKECFALRLEYPGSDCGATRWGQFCARFPDGALPAAMIAVIAKALRAAGEEGIWTVPPTPLPPSLLGRMTGAAARWVAALRGLNPAVVARTLGTCLGLILVPISAGWLVGLGLRRLRRARAGGVAWPVAVTCLAVSAALVLDARLALVGVWDAAVIALLLVAGLLVALHRAFADPRNLALGVGAALLGLLLLEPASRLVLPPPPAFPSQQGPELLLSEAIRLSAKSGMSAALGQTLTCQLVYPPSSASDLGPQIPSADTYTPRPDASARVLHLGDSVVYGSAIDGRFTDDLAELEPNVEHINAAVFATAPDAHLALLRRWIARQPIDAVVMHLNPNDSLEIDGPYPCAGWESLLVYDGGAPRLRYATDHPIDHPNRLRLLLERSPPPYLLRAALRFSAAAAHLAAACVQLGRSLGYTSLAGGPEVGSAHIEMILRAARDELGARHIALVADVLHYRFDAEARLHQTTLKAIPEDLGIVTLDSWEPLIASLDRGEQPFTNAGGATDSHFSAAGHAMMAQWLHEELPAAIQRARRDPSLGN